MIRRVQGHRAQAPSSFSRWFSGSKVVDTAGKPLVVYHGTRSHFDQFDPFRAPFWFAESPEDASEYALNLFPGFAAGPGTHDSMVRPAFLQIRNPFDLGARFDSELEERFTEHLVMELRGDDSVEEFLDYLNDRYAYAGTLRDVQQLLVTDFCLGAPEGTMRCVYNILEDLGFDGVIVHPNRIQVRRGRGFVVFEPEQIRSAVGGAR